MLKSHFPFISATPCTRAGIVPVHGNCPDSREHRNSWESEKTINEEPIYFAVSEHHVTETPRFKNNFLSSLLFFVSLNKQQMPTSESAVFLQTSGRVTASSSSQPPITEKNPNVYKFVLAFLICALWRGTLYNFMCRMLSPVTQPHSHDGPYLILFPLNLLTLQCIINTDIKLRNHIFKKCDDASS